MKQNENESGVPKETRHAEDGKKTDALLDLINGDKLPVTTNVFKQPKPEAEVLTKREAAAMLAVSTRTMDRLVSRGDIPHIRLSRRCVRFPSKQLLAWIEARRKGWRG